MQSVLIHEFDAHKPPILDDDGDPMIGFYYQFINAEDKPLSGLIGPYKRKGEAATAAQRAFDTNDM